MTNYKASSSTFTYTTTIGFGPTAQYVGNTPSTTDYPGWTSCDGGLYPTNSGIRISDLADGTSHTMLCVETMDFITSTWIFGGDVNGAAIPTQQSPSPKPVKWNSSFFALPNYNGNFYDNGGTSNFQTYFAMEFGITGKMAGKYELNAALVPCNQPSPARPTVNPLDIYGPSSGHPSVINCLFGDGGVRGVRKDVDAAALHFAVTRNNNDPAATDNL